jgi:hypothetical protein
MPIHDLTSLVEPPTTPREVPKRSDWKRAEKYFGTALPQDYQEFVTTYGTGVLGHFLVVCNPFSQDKGFALPEFVDRVCKNLKDLKNTEGDSQVPFGIFPERPGLFPWGGDENGNGLYWLTEGEPDAWPCVLGEGRGPRWERYEMTMTAFLAGVFRGEIRPKFWPRGFPSKRDQVFEPSHV